MKKMEDYSDNLSVLIIEDNLGDFILIEDYLLDKFKDITIEHCSNYFTAVEYLRNSDKIFSVILLDLSLSDMAGIQLINNILSYNFRIPIIILTGYSDLALAKSSLQIGIYDYLVKDEINPAILYKTIMFARHRSSFVNQIEDEKRNYEDLFNFNPQPTWLLDAKTLTVLHANIAAQKKYGFSLDEFLMMSFTDLHPKEEEDLIKQTLLSQNVDFNRTHFTHVLNDGQEIKVDIYFRKFKNISNNGLIVQSNDVSEMLRYINTVEIQNSKLLNIAWTQSHEVRAPLSRILGIVNLLEDQPENFNEINFWLTQLRISANEMDEIVHKIVDETSHLKD